MANKKISELAAIPALATDDELPIVDVSASATTKVSLAALLAYINAEPADSTILKEADIEVIVAAQTEVENILTRITALESSSLPAQSLPLTPLSFTATQNAASPSSQIDLAWVSNSQQYANVVSYYLYIDGAVSPIILSSSVLSYAATGLSADTLHTFSLYGVNGAGTSEVPATDSASTAAAAGTPPVMSTFTGAVVDNQKYPNITAMTATNLPTHWLVTVGESSAPSGSDSRWATDVNDWINEVKKATAPSYGVLYTVRGYAKNADGVSDAMTFTFTASDTQGPATVTGLTHTTKTTTTINLSWPGVSDAGTDGGSGLVSYNIYDGATDTLIRNTGSTALTASMTGLTANTSYSFKVAGVDAAGNVGTLSSAYVVSTDAVAGGTFVISSLSVATLNHGSAMTVSGELFSTKPHNVAPLVWDNCEGTDPTVLWTQQVAPNEQGIAGEAPYLMDYKTPAEVGTGIALPHTHGTKYLTGVHYEEWINYYTGPNVHVSRSFTRPLAKYHFCLEYSVRFAADWQFIDSDPVRAGYNCKDFAFGNQSNTPYGAEVIYVNYTDQSFTAVGDVPKCQIWGNSHPLVLPGPSPTISNTGYSTLNANNPCADWIKMRYEVFFSPDTDGYFRRYENGVLVLEYLGPTQWATPAAIQSFLVGGYTWMTKQIKNRRYLKDIHADTSRCQVWLCDTDNFATATIAEVQPVSSWSDTDVVVTGNLATFTVGQTAYVVLRREDGQYTTGYPVTIGT